MKRLRPTAVAVALTLTANTALVLPQIDPAQLLSRADAIATVKSRGLSIWPHETRRH